MKPPIKVGIADDHAIVRKGVRFILEESEKIQVVAEFSSKKEVLQNIEKIELSVLVLDINFEDGSGIDLMKWIKDSKLDLKVLMLTTYPENQYAMRAFKAGAFGYINKLAMPDILLDAVVQIANGKRYLTETLSNLFLTQFDESTSEDKLHQSLSDQEYRTLCLLAVGKPLTEIATEMCISAKTVTSYRSRILTKFKMKSNADLISYAIKHNLLT